jgi:hypothetical protein
VVPPPASATPAQLYQWVNQNHQLFRGQVYGPLVLDINMRVQQHATVVEQQCQQAFGHFVVTHKWVARARPPAAAAAAAVSLWHV